MQRVCAGCGKGFETKRSHAKWCSTTCRQRGRRRGGTAAGKAAPPNVRGLSLVDAVERELTEAGRLDTADGQLALAIARTISSPFTTGPAVATLAKELRAAKTEALRGAHSPADPIDELRRRREQKLAAG